MTEGLVERGEALGRGLRRHHPGRTGRQVSDVRVCPGEAGEGQVARGFARVHGGSCKDELLVSADAAPEDRSFLQHAMVARSFITAGAYPELVRDAGFEIEQILDVSGNVMATFGAVAAALQEKDAAVRKLRR